MDNFYERCTCYRNSRADPVDSLTKCTRFSRREIKVIYRNFKQHCPHGQLESETLRDVLNRFFPCGNSHFYAQNVFRTIDLKGKGRVCFKDFVIWLSEVSRGSTQDKLRWIFRLYDVDQDGYISRSDFSLIIKSIYLMLGKREVPDERYISEKTESFFVRFDENGDGNISVEEFVSNCSKDEHVVKSLFHFHTIF